MSCQAELVTGYVDGALDEPVRLEIEAHLASCEQCRAQADSERALRSRLLGLLHPVLPEVLPEQVAVGLRRRPPRRPALLWIPLAAAAALAVFTVRQSPQAAAWELARDHDHCFGRDRLPTQISSEEPEVVMRWLESQGTRVPVLPLEIAGRELQGARYCTMPDLTRAAHIYYGRGHGTPLSVFVIARAIGPREPSQVEAHGHLVRLMRMGDITVGVVGDRQEEIDRFIRTLSTTRASVE